MVGFTTLATGCRRVVAIYMRSSILQPAKRVGNSIYLPVSTWVRRTLELVGYVAEARGAILAANTCAHHLAFSLSASRNRLR